jgi:Exocyst complex subunit SEC6
MSASVPRKLVTNPFGNDSDEEESSDGFHNPFAVKKSATPALATATTATTATVSAPLNTSGIGSTNPFDNDRQDNDPLHKDATSKRQRNTTMAAAVTATAVSSTNPFDDSKTKPTNEEKDRPSLTTTSTTTSSSSLFPSLNPSHNDTKPKRVTHTASKDVVTFDSSTNPFSSSSSSAAFEDVFAPSSSSQPPPQPQPRHVRRQTTQAISMSSQSQKVTNHETSTSLFEFPDLDLAGDATTKKSMFARRKTTSLTTSTVPTSSEPLANAVDQEETEGERMIPSSSSCSTRISSNSYHGEKKSVGTSSSPAKPNVIKSHLRSKSDGMALKGAGGGKERGGGGGDSSDKEMSSLGGWLRGGNKVANENPSSVMMNNNNNNNNNNSMGSSFGTPKRTKGKQTFMNKLTPGGRKKNMKEKERKKKKNVFVQCWPYDDYHKEQEKYYESIQENGTPRSSTSSRKRWGDVNGKSLRRGGGGGDSSFGGYNSGSDDEDGIGMMMTSSSKDEMRDYANEGMLLERPADLSSIKEAVQNLSLFDFESKAKDRAISIVSTWLFDSGLIDELLVNGMSGYGGGTGMNGPSGSNYSMAGYSYSTSVASVRSSEGVEVGAHGFPLEGSFKIDKEAEKLRASTQRELTLINTRLNDGVAASGSEVQELVNAVSTTKSELGRLRELATYISSGYKEDSTLANKKSNDGKNALILSEYPRLKRAINARRNIFRCFRELEFFSQIPLTCDRLREELHQGEWTANEWSTIRDVCMEHVELEILLVEAEAGMKAWLDDEDDGDDDSSMPSLRSNKSLKKSWKGRQQAALLAGNHQVVDEFLSQHVKNVWELGDEIRMRILSGVGSAYDLALQNPAGMVALVEAVEVYERAADQFKASRGGEYESNKNHLRFTDMRAAALAQLYQDFELRGLEVFRAIHMQAADIADESDALNSQFNAVLRAATELVTEIDVVKNQMAPCFAPHWHVEMLWSSCVAHVCSNQIIQQIGGPEGQNLPDLSVTQLLDLVAWVEFFRETIEDAFPSIGSVSSKKTYFDERPDLFAGNQKVVNMENAKDSLAWVNNMLWEVHRLAQDEFLLRTRSQSDEWITKVYSAKHETTQTREGRLVTSLCEDVFSLASVQLRTIRERLTKKSDALVMAVCLIFSQLRSKQLSARNTFLTDLESCCAAANDFQRMSEQVEDMVNDLIDHSELPQSSVQMLEDSCGALVSLYSGDAVYAAQRAHGFIFEPIEEAISEELFGPKWEVELTSNELAMTLTRTLVRGYEVTFSLWLFIFLTISVSFLSIFIG